MRYSYKDPLFY